MRKNSRVGKKEYQRKKEKEKVLIEKEEREEKKKESGERGCFCLIPSDGLQCN